MKYELHPACAVWPEMSAANLKELAADIKANGLMEPITLTPDGLLLDGRNRTLACEMVGVTPITVVYHGNPIAFSISKNKMRRHLGKNKTALIGSQLANLKLGTNRYEKKVGGPIGLPTMTVKEVASQLEISEQSVKRAKVINDKAIPEIAELVANQKLGLISAAIYAHAIPREKQVADPKVIKAFRTAKEKTPEAVAGLPRLGWQKEIHRLGRALHKIHSQWHKAAKLMLEEQNFDDFDRRTFLDIMADAIENITDIRNRILAIKLKHIPGNGTPIRRSTN
jgi:hypothetical protein